MNRHLHFLGILYYIILFLKKRGQLPFFGSFSDFFLNFWRFVKKYKKCVDKNVILEYNILC